MAARKRPPVSSSPGPLSGEPGETSPPGPLSLSGEGEEAGESPPSGRAADKTDALETEAGAPEDESPPTSAKKSAWPPAADSQEDHDDEALSSPSLDRERGLGGEVSPAALSSPSSAKTERGPGGEVSPESTEDSPVVRQHLLGLLEALLFVSPEPMSVVDLARIAQADRRLVRELLGELHEHYKNRGLRLDEVADGFCFRTNPLYGPFVRELTGARPVKLTRAQIETLAIVAYRQPITRPEIDDVRGVDSGPMLKLLLERELIRILGKKEEPGRPLLYGTTPNFLEFFGIRSLRELPTLRDFADLTEESRAAYQRILGEAPPENPLDVGGLAEGEGHLVPVEEKPVLPASAYEEDGIPEPPVVSNPVDGVDGVDPADPMNSVDPADDPVGARENAPIPHVPDPSPVATEEDDEDDEDDEDEDDEDEEDDEDDEDEDEDDEDEDDEDEEDEEDDEDDEDDDDE